MTDLANKAPTGTPSILPEPIDRLASSLRREREGAGLSVSELAKRSGLAKSTLSQLEAGNGNPSLETLWSLAMTLGIAVSRLIGEARAPIQVIRAGEGKAAISDNGRYEATLLAACPASAKRDLYRIKVQPGEPHVSGAHGIHTIEHVIVSAGAARIGPDGDAIVLRTGDYISYPADTPHIFEALEPDTLAIMLIESA